MARFFVSSSAAEKKLLGIGYDAEMPGTYWFDPAMDKLQRLLPETDPLSRQIMMSQGTFIELLDIAAAK